MCGLVGFSGKNNVDKRKLQILMLMARNRGHESAGYGYYEIQNGTDYRCINKRSEDPRTFVSKIRVPKVNTIIGHTRNPSRGTLKKQKHAHPFSFPTLIGAHNGYVRNWNILQAKYGTDFDVDSEFFFHILSEKHGGDLSKALYEIYGDVAFTWINKDRELHLYRYGKPLHIGRDENEDMYYASESDYLKVIGCKQIIQLDENVEYIYKEGELVKKNKDLPEPKYSSERHSVAKKEDDEETVQHQIFHDTDGGKIHNLSICMQGKHAPVDCNSFVGTDGKLTHTWVEDNKIKVEKVKAYGLTDLRTFDMKHKQDLVQLSTHFPQISKFYLQNGKLKN